MDRPHLESPPCVVLPHIKCTLSTTYLGNAYSRLSREALEILSGSGPVHYKVPERCHIAHRDMAENTTHEAKIRLIGHTWHFIPANAHPWLVSRPTTDVSMRMHKRKPAAQSILAFPLPFSIFFPLHHLTESSPVTPFPEVPFRGT